MIFNKFERINYILYHIWIKVNSSGEMKMYKGGRNVWGSVTISWENNNEKG